MRRYCGTSPHILKGEYKLGVSEIKSLRKIFGLKRDGESEKFTIIRVHKGEFRDTGRLELLGFEI
jgi:hypothetical protein